MIKAGDYVRGTSRIALLTYRREICYSLRALQMRYGACSSVVERQIADLVVVGSIPTRHPLSLINKTVTRRCVREPDDRCGAVLMVKRL